MKTMPIFFTRALSIVTCSLMVLTSAWAQTKPSLSDAEIASIAVVANQIDIDYAGIAKKNSKNKDILHFAVTMANDHQTVINQATALVNKLNVTPKDNAIGQKLNADAKKTETSLKSLSGKAFDKAYIDNEVTYHKAVISTVETLLIPQAKNAELKQLLQNVLPALKTHLTHAEKVQKEFK